MAGSPEHVLALFESLMEAKSLEDAVRGAARRVHEALRADSVGIVVLIHSGVFLETWYPEEHPRPREQFQTLKGLVSRVAQSGSAAMMPLGGNPRLPLVAHAMHLPLGHRLRGGVCVVSPHELDAAAPACVPLDRLARLIAMRLNDLIEIEAEKRKSQQFERWFRVSDKQIRALDLERQKFAALVSSFMGGAFVATRDGIISWQSRPLLDRSGNADDTWVGRPCRELCQALCGGHRLACGECLVEQVLASRSAATLDFTLSDGCGQRSTRAVAAPINDLAGRAQEVIVTLQETVPGSRSAAA